jgi:drug/metabolite transporter (DMT)-like permease
MSMTTGPHFLKEKPPGRESSLMTMLRNWSILALILLGTNVMRLIRWSRSLRRRVRYEWKYTWATERPNEDKYGWKSFAIAQFRYMFSPPLFLFTMLPRVDAVIVRLLSQSASLIRRRSLIFPFSVAYRKLRHLLQR